MSASRNSTGSAVSWSTSAIRCIQARSKEMSSFSLYPQWAAMPYSARRCISWVRTWTSMGLPSSPMTVVCSDW